MADVRCILIFKSGDSSRENVGFRSVDFKVTARELKVSRVTKWSISSMEFGYFELSRCICVCAQNLGK